MVEWGKRWHLPGWDKIPLREKWKQNILSCCRVLGLSGAEVSMAVPFLVKIPKSLLLHHGLVWAVLQWNQAPRRRVWSTWRELPWAAKSALNYHRHPACSVVLYSCSQSFLSVQRHRSCGHTHTPYKWFKLLILWAGEGHERQRLVFISIFKCYGNPDIMIVKTSDNETVLWSAFLFVTLLWVLGFLIFYQNNQILSKVKGCL